MQGQCCLKMRFFWKASLETEPPSPPWVLVPSHEAAGVGMLMVTHQLRFPSAHVSAKPWQSPRFGSEQRLQRHSGQCPTFLIPSLNGRVTAHTETNSRETCQCWSQGSCTEAPAKLFSFVSQPFLSQTGSAHPADWNTLPWVWSTCKNSVNSTNWRNSLQPRLYSCPEEKAEFQ